MKDVKQPMATQGWTEVPDCPWLRIGDDWVAYCGYWRSTSGSSGEKAMERDWRKSSTVAPVVCTPAACRVWSTPERRAQVKEKFVSAIPRP